MYKHSLYGTVKFTATYLKCVSLLDFLRAAWASHWLLSRPGKSTTNSPTTNKYPILDVGPLHKIQLLYYL